MITSPFFRRLLLAHLLLIAAAIGIVGAFAARVLRETYIQRTEQAMRDSSLLVAQLIEPSLGRSDDQALQKLVVQLGRSLNCRVTIIRADGVVVADNEADPAHMENHATRPEVASAMNAGEGLSLRESGTVHDQLLYFARRINVPDAAGASSQAYSVRLSVHLRELARQLQILYWGLAFAGLVALVGAGAASVYMARRQAVPVVELTRFADDLSHGQLDRRLSPPDRDAPREISTLATSLNAMADSLSSLITQTKKDAAELATIVASMSEGLIATDTQQRILLYNASAAHLLDFESDDPQGKPLWEIVCNEPILRATTDVLESRQKQTFQIGPFAGRHLEVTVCTFPQAAEPQGLVIVVHDATQSVRYQELRREFVANVSHELRTPLTAIKGFTETLRDGALSDPVRGPQFLATIERHADQLTNLVRDLLELSRLESQPGLRKRVPVDLAATIRKAVDLLTTAANKKRHAINVHLDGSTPQVIGDPDYVERAVANLLDNAIKYTPDGGVITISTRREESPREPTTSANGRSIAPAATDGFAVIEVTDNGIGIPRNDLARVFERFYRVDRSRSRDMGGTGLGLAIVKHVAQSHNGAVEVTSTPGHGSTFRLKLPQET